MFEALVYDFCKNTTAIDIRYDMMTYLRSDSHLIVERDELFVESAVRLLGGGRGGGRALDMDK